MFASSFTALPGPNRIRFRFNCVTSISALEAIFNSVALVLVTEILVPPVIVISSFVFPDSVTPSNLIAVEPLGTNKSYFVSVRVRSAVKFG